MSVKEKEKFASQADPQILAELRRIAEEEGRHFQAILDEALRDLIEKKKGNKPRAKVMLALQDSMRDFDDLYKELAK